MTATAAAASSPAARRAGEGTTGAGPGPAGGLRLDELVHEVRGTVAAIAAATRILIDRCERPADPTGRRLERLVDTELRRLERLLGGGAEEQPGDEPLAGAIADAVLSHRIRGRAVRWTERPCGTTRHGRVVREVLHGLLDNAARHAPGALVAIDVARHGDRVEVAVSDTGPGVPPALAGAAFERGVCGPGSSGSGLGLYLARRLLAEAGGGLRLDPAPRGASFVLDLPSGQAPPAPPTTGAARPTRR